MQNYFEVKSSFIRVDDDGRERKVSESYLFDAVSFTDAEARITKQLAEIIRGEFVVDKISKSRIIEVFPNESGEYWWKAKINIVAIDEKAGKEKKMSNYFLVAADNLKEAVQRLEEGLPYMLVPYEVVGVVLSPIIEVYPYFEEDLIAPVSKFPEFWYESNACWGNVSSIEELQEKCNLQINPKYGGLQTKDEFLDRSMQHYDGSLNFGTRIEHTGKKSLRQFLLENNINF